MKIFIYKCGRGHTFKSSVQGPFHLKVGTLKIPIGAVCPHCLAKFIDDNLVATDVTEVEE